MSMPKYAKRRDKSEPQIVKDLRGCGVDVYLTDKPFDGILGYRGKTYLGEFKTLRKEGGMDKLTDDQLKFIKTWRGGPVVFFRTRQDVTDWINQEVKGD